MYSISELSKLDEIDTANGVKNFSGLQEYFDGLTKFTRNSAGYLVGYNPTMVIYSDEIRGDFLAKVNEVRSILTSLGMTARASEMKYLEDAVQKNDPAILADEMSVFAARMEQISNHIISALNSEKKTILVVNDSPETLESIVNIIGGKFKVVGVTTKDAALEAMESQEPELFLLDLELPHTDVYDLTGEIRGNEKFKNTPIIFLTGKSSRKDVMIAKKHGVKDYILKPLNKTLLLGKIHKYLQ